MQIHSKTAYSYMNINDILFNRLPFSVVRDPFYSAANQRHLTENISQAEAGHVTVHELLPDD